MSWQISPLILAQAMTSGDQAVIDRVTQVCLSMKQFDVARLEAAVRGTS